MTDVRLRDVEDGDLDAFYRHQADPEAAQMAAFPARDRDTFDAHWSKIRADGSVTIRTVEADGQVAGNIGSWTADGRRLVGYSFGREHWGRGIATAALTQLLTEIPARPIYAYVAAHNAGSIRVLSKCGFRPETKQTGPDGVEEYVYVLT
ncbi:GNAT family N-acetyltransferase [Actinoplanes sp. CA-030573]|uniref:GNAT family N-acetyltransferase n=1 Tax=Actinoplanes sp. CA-030573 TaxID=3239898 RepID=UPI003D910197